MVTFLKELPDDLNIARHDVEQPAPVPRPASNQISLVEPSATPAEPEASVYTSSPVVIPAEAWKDDSACSLCKCTVKSVFYMQIRIAFLAYCNFYWSGVTIFVVAATFLFERSPP